MKRFLTGLLIGLSMVANSHAAYPEKPIRFVVAFAPGSSIDISIQGVGVLSNPVTA
jgi:tripartite-type tricarboxylate transporter receptor subunit TctC